MKKADFILIAIVLAVVGVLAFFLYGMNQGSGTYVQIEVDGKVTQTLRLDENKTVDIETADDGFNKLTIEDGYAKMTEANCPDKICAKHPKIHKTGDSIICLPHKVVVSIVDEAGEDEIDVVA